MILLPYEKHVLTSVCSPVVKKEKTTHVQHNTDNAALHTQQIAEETRFEDLDIERPQDVAPLNIENHRIYFESRVLADQARANTEELSRSLDFFKQQVAEWRPDSRPSVVPAPLANTILTEITQSTQKYNNMTQGQNASGGWTFEILKLICQSSTFLKI